MNKVSYILTAIFFIMSFSVKADNFKSTKTSNNFVLSRDITINARNIPAEDYTKIRDVINRHSGSVAEKFSIKKITLPTISFHKVKRVTGSFYDGYQIDITDKYIKIKYTSLATASKAVDLLMELVVTNTRGEKCFQGGQYTWTDEDKGKSITKNTLMANEIKQLLASFNSMVAGSTTELIIVTPYDWMMETNSIAEFVGNNSLYSSRNGYLSIDQLRDVITKAEEHNIKLYISLQLEEENNPILESTGHSLYSVEGMRFLRAALSEWHEKCNIKDVNIKTKSGDDMIAKRFYEFLNTIAPLIGININIIL